jgi:hypothetical protein
VIDDVPVDPLVHALDFAARRSVDGVEQRRERVAQAEAAPATVADVENALQLFQQERFVAELGIALIERMAGGSFEAPFA